MRSFALTLGIPVCLLITGCNRLAQAQDDAQLSAKYRQAAMQGGNSARGKLIFDSPKAQCAACHVVEGNDRKAGPPLATIGDKLARDQLLTSILEPSAMIHPDYGRITVATKDGNVVAGVLNRRTETAIELFDVEGKLKHIALVDVDVEKKGGPSLMPQGLYGAITEDQFADLIAYLSSLKQIVPDVLQGQGLVDDIRTLSQPIQLQPLHEAVHRFDFAVCVLPVPGTSNQFVVVEQKSRKVWRLIKDPSGDRKELFADLSAEAISGEFEGRYPKSGPLDFACHGDSVSTRLRVISG
jgi:putative heme-binding domain-containing protein